jgi:uncharacterized membrane protein
MKTTWGAVLLILVSTFFNVIAQTSYKYAAPAFELTWQGTLFNLPLWVGFISYGCSALLVILAFRHGEMSTLFPFVSLTFIWVLLSSWLILRETISLPNILGIGIIIAGILLLGTTVEQDKKVDGVSA